MNTFEGKCQKCDDYFTSIGHPTVCLIPDCKIRDIIRPNGLCDECPVHKIPDIQTRVCIIPICEDRERIMLSGQCELCPDHFTLNA